MLSDFKMPGESLGWGSLVGCRLWDRTESDTTEVTQQQQQQQRSIGEGNGNQLQYVCLENLMDGGDWQASPWGGEESDMTE